MKVSIIATIRNEALTIDDLIRSIFDQTRLPDEVVIADGGSTDNTVDLVERWIARGSPICLLKCTGANIAAGRNRAIEASTGEIIASTDAGARLDPRWLEKIVAPVESGADVCMGFFVGAPRTTFERALAATTLPDVDEIDPARFIASSRSIAFTRAAWTAVGGYPEWLDYCEDVVFDLKLRSAGLRFAWQPGAIVHYRPRTGLSSYARQYYRYARGDGKANLWPLRQIARYLTYAVAPLVTLSGFWYKRSWLLVAVGASIYLYRPWRRVVKSSSGLSAGDRLSAFGYVPFLRLVGDVAKMIGYPVGVLWRLRRERADG